MKKFGSAPWMTIACLCMEVLALIFITLMLVCPAPFEHNNLAMIVIQPSNSSSTTHSTVPLPTSISNSTSSSLGSITSTPIFSSTSTPITGSTTTSTIPLSTSTSVNNSSNTTDNATTTTATATPTVTLAIRRRELMTSDPMLSNGTNSRVDVDPMGKPTQLERLNSTALVTSSSINSTVLMRIGPLGSCFRTSDNVETCTSAKLSSKYDFRALQNATFNTSGLPTGMSTYPLVLLILIIALLLKSSLDAAIIFSPDGTFSTSLSSLSSGWQSSANWLTCAECLLLAIASGVERNKMSTAVKSFNASNIAISIDSHYLTAQTGTSFGFVWIASILLAVSFFFRRVAIKKQAMADRAKLEFLGDNSNKYSGQAPLPRYRANVYEEESIPPSNRRSGLGLLRELLTSNSNKSEQVDPHQRPPTPASNISLPTMVIDDYIRRHCYPPENSSLPKVPSLGHLKDYRYQAKESPPFHAYQSGIEEESKAKKEAEYIEDIRHKMASPAPSYWTMTERAQDFQSRREKEREYMAELRRQRSVMD